MSVVARITGQVLGSATSDELSPYSQLTITVNALNVAGGQTLTTLTQSPSILASLPVAQNVSIYIASSPADIAAVEAAVTVLSIDSIT